MKMIVIKKYGRPGCGPCRALSGYFTEIDLESLNAELEEYNTDEMTDEEVEEAKLNGVPTLIFYRNGVEVARMNELRPVDEIIDAIEYAKAVR